MSLILGFNEKYLPAFGKNWFPFLIWGIALVVLGCVAIAAATFTTLLSVIFIGFILLLSGIVLLFDTFTFWRGKWSGFFLHLLFSILYLAIGFTLIKDPLAGSVSLTFLLGIFYIIMGIFRVTFLPTLRAPMWGWGWLNGIITLLLGILILLSLPSSSLFIIGLFVGLDILFCGIAYIMSALTAKKRYQ
jgi:uncharacterized membrane protein HdeD (DUF308 family)